MRFIAVNDGVDSAVESSNDFNPIRNWANELHAKDTSRKVRAVKKSCRLNAANGSEAVHPMGTENRNYGKPSRARPGSGRGRAADFYPSVLLGKGPSQIARILTERNILTPANYYFQKAGKTHKGVRCAASMHMVWYNGQ